MIISVSPAFQLHFHKLGELRKFSHHYKSKLCNDIVHDMSQKKKKKDKRLPLRKKKKKFPEMITSLGA